MNHRFVVFKNEQAFHKGTVCPICTVPDSVDAYHNQLQNQTSLYLQNVNGQGNQSFVQKFDIQRYSKLLDMARFQK